MLARWLALPALLLLLFGSGARAQVAVPQLRGPVTDLTGTLTTEQIASLDRELRDFQARKGNYIAILIVPTTQPEAIEQYSLRVAEAWKLRRAGVNDGLLVLVAKQDRAVRIEVDYGLEGAVPDVLANRIIEGTIVPKFRAGDYFGGLHGALERLFALIEGEPLPEPEKPAPRAEGIGSLLPLLLMVVLVGGGFLRRMLGTFGGASVTAGIAAAVVWFLTSTLIIAIGAAVIAFVIALLGGGGGGGWTSGRRRGWGGGIGGWTGGGWGGGGFGGGGGGGWGGGGGGGWGGGGASGRW
jgi:uncharacterized protein